MANIPRKHGPEAVLNTLDNFGPMTVDDIWRRTSRLPVPPCKDRDGIQGILSHLRKAHPTTGVRKVYVFDWVDAKAVNGSLMLMAVYASGDGVDAPKPVATSIERKLAAEGRLHKPTPGGDLASAWFNVAGFRQSAPAQQ